MASFWWAVAGLSAVALLFIGYPLWRAGHVGQAEEDNSDPNVQLFKEHLADLEQQHKRGELADEELAELRLELQRGLLSESESNAARSKAKPTMGQWPVVVLLVAVPVAATLVYQKLGASQDLSIIQRLEASSQMLADSDPGADQARLEVLQQIEQRLEQDPDNFYYWIISGRLNVERQQYDRALKSYRRADRLSAGNDLTLLQEYLDAAFKTKDRANNAEMKALADRLLALDPNNLAVLGLRGRLAFAEGDYRRAVTEWSKVLQAMPPGHAATMKLESELDKARQQLSSEDLAAMNKSRIQLRLTADDELVGEMQDASEGAVLFVIARQVGQDAGPPLAVKRLKMTELPLDVILDDSNLMLPGTSLENVSEVSVTARVSRSGGVAAQPGDFQGALQTVAVGGDVVSLVIDTKL